MVKHQPWRCARQTAVGGSAGGQAAADAVLASVEHNTPVSVDMTAEPSWVGESAGRLGQQNKG